MHMLYKTGTVCLRVTGPHLIFDHICVRTLRTHIRCIIPEDIALALNQVLSLCPIPITNPILSGGDMQSNSTSGSTIYPSKQ